MSSTKQCNDEFTIQKVYKMVSKCNTLPQALGQSVTTRGAMRYTWWTRCNNITDLQIFVFLTSNRWISTGIKDRPSTTTYRCRCTCIAMPLRRSISYTPILVLIFIVFFFCNVWCTVCFTLCFFSCFLFI